MISIDAQRAIRWVLETILITFVWMDASWPVALTLTLLALRAELEDLRR